jgi:hypothetical protein
MSLILDGTNGLSDVDGSASTPAIRGTDANTGMFFPAADTIAFSEGGTESMRLNSAGNVGIGVTTILTPNSRVNTLQVGTNAAGGSTEIVLGHQGDGFSLLTAGGSGVGSMYISQGTTELAEYTYQGIFKFNSGYGSVATAYGVRAWVNFNGSNGSINGSGGVSSVTRNGTGDYTVAYSFTFPSNTYTLWGMGRRNSATQRPVLLCMNNSFYENTTTGARFFTMLNDSATVEDPIQFWFGAIR